MVSVTLLKHGEGFADEHGFAFACPAKVYSLH